jgi:glycosyltransferase involved in cell wall biosynthesis
VIGVRDRADHHLANALRCLRDQAYPAELIRIVLVDYGSAAAGASSARRMCAEHGAEYVRVDNVSVWSRARSLNVGIRLATTKFLLTCDVDILLSRDYLSDAVRLLTPSPLSIVGSAMLDLPEESADILESSARVGGRLELDAWRKWCRPRYGWESHPSISIAYTVVYQAIGGLDEFYEAWGYEDSDLIRRFVYLGLEPLRQDSSSFYLHQWHSDAERGRRGALAWRTERNKAHFSRTHSILRNRDTWGLGAWGGVSRAQAPLPSDD